MARAFLLGEFEQLTLATLIRLRAEPYALPLREALSQLAGRPVSRGALYRTLDRLEQKGYVSWKLEKEAPKRGGYPRRRFRVTKAGLDAVRRSRRALLDAWAGLEEVLE